MCWKLPHCLKLTAGRCSSQVEALFEGMMFDTTTDSLNTTSLADLKQRGHRFVTCVGVALIDCKHHFGIVMGCAHFRMMGLCGWLQVCEPVPEHDRRKPPCH